MSRCVIKIVDIAGPFPCPMKGQYLKSVDFEARRGRGQAWFTRSREGAMTFDNAGDAMQFWRTRSKTVPTRPDGKPNRPLTAFTVEIVRWEDAV